MDRHLDDTRAYYDEFSHRYEHHRRPNDPYGYHALVDDLEVDITRRYATGRDLLECGCGTGLLLERFSGFARRAVGIDLSPGMLERARARGLEVHEGSVTSLPFDDASFDVTCSFKVLAHVRDIEVALSEMLRVTRPGGMVLAEFYNPRSLRGVAKRVGPAGAISDTKREDAVFTRFDTPRDVRAMIPRGAELEGAHGVRVLTPTAAAMRVPALRGVLRTAESWLARRPWAAPLGGFYVAVIRRTDAF